MLVHCISLSAPLPACSAGHSVLIPDMTWMNLFLCFLFPIMIENLCILNTQDSVWSYFQTQVLKFTKNLSSCYLKIWSRWSYRFDILLQKIVPLCKWIRDWFLKKLTDQVDIAKWHLTKKVSLNSKEQGNCLVSWWTQSSHWRNTGHLWFSSWFCPWPHLSAKRWPNSNHSRVTNTWNPL